MVMYYHQIRGISTLGFGKLSRDVKKFLGLAQFMAFVGLMYCEHLFLTACDLITISVLFY